MIHEQDMRVTVTSTLSPESGGGIVILRYDSADPYVVSLILPNQRWILSRDLLLDSFGSTRTQGTRDVQVLNDEENGQTVLFLDSHEGIAALKFDSKDMETFLSETYDIVAVGSESAIVSSELDTILPNILTTSEE